MFHRSRWALGAWALVALVALLGGFVATSFVTRAQKSGGDDDLAYAVGASADPSAARTELPGLTPATGEPTLPGFDTARPSVGTVARVAGPFDERYAWSHLRLDRSRVRGDLTVISDVSDLLELEVLVGFYDRKGRLLDTGKFVRHHSLHDDSAFGLPDESIRVHVDVPRQLRRTAVAAAVGVPVLVNE